MRIYSRLSRDVVELPDNRRFLGIMFYRGGGTRNSGRPFSNLANFGTCGHVLLEFRSVTSEVAFKKTTAKYAYGRHL